MTQAPETVGLCERLIAAKSETPFNGKKCGTRYLVSERDIDEAASTIRAQADEIERLRGALEALVAMYACYQQSDRNHENAHSAFVGWQPKHDAWAVAARALSTNPDGEA